MEDSPVSVELLKAELRRALVTIGIQERIIASLTRELTRFSDPSRKLTRRKKIPTALDSRHIRG